MRHKGLLAISLILLVATTMRAQFLHQPGDKARDFEGVTVDGREYHLYDSQAERIIICFWAVDCDYCHDFLKALRRNVDLKNDYELVTFALAETPKQVRRKARCMRIHGWHFFDEAGWDSQPFLDYDVTSTPTVILIDKDKNIIGEAYDFDEFELLRRQEKEDRNSETIENK